MRHILLPLILLLMAAGCSPDEESASGRRPVTIGEMGIAVHGAARTWMQSDRAGAFLTGETGGEETCAWSVDGAGVLKGLRVETPQGILTSSMLDSALISPQETALFYRGAVVVRIAALEGLSLPGAHAFIVGVTLTAPGRVTLHALPVSGKEASAPASVRAWSLPRGVTLLLSAGEGGTVAGDGLSRDGTAGATFLVMDVPAGTDPAVAGAVYRGADSLIALRTSRMELLLNRAYFRTSDERLEKAVRWMMLSLDALVVNRADTFAVAGLPWDGTISVRDNAQAIGGLGPATGDLARTASILRSLARYQDTLPGSRSFGRLPDRIAGGRPAYEGADVTPVFVRELYDQVVNADDTTLLRSLYPLVTRSIDGTIRRHVDGGNLLVHGPYETWMKGIPRGIRAVEIESEWFYQQLIGRFAASYLADSIALRRWEGLPEKTGGSFMKLFADTAAHALADHVDADGTRSADVRPNALMCLDMLDGEAMRHGVTRAVVTGLLEPEGVRTLPAGDPRASAPRGPGSAYNGPAWTWLAGPLSYALTRYDRQDVSFPLMERLASAALDSGMAGTLPAILDPGPAGADASLTGMAEYLRSIYQDYFGVHLDMSAGTLSFQPKLPASLRLAQFTVYAGGMPVEVEFRKGEENIRLYMNAPSLQRELHVTLLWVMDSGDAWRGSFRLHSGTPVAVVLGTDDVALYQGTTRGDLEGKRKLKGFSLRAEAADLSPVAR